MPFPKKSVRNFHEFSLNFHLERLSDLNETLTDPIEIEIIEKIHQFLEREKKIIKNLTQKENSKKFYILSM